MPRKRSTGHPFGRQVNVWTALYASLTTTLRSLMSFRPQSEQGSFALPKDFIDDSQQFSARLSSLIRFRLVSSLSPLGVDNDREFPLRPTWTGATLRM